MKKIVLVVVLLAIIQEWGTIRDFINPPAPLPDYGLMHDEQVVLYSAEWCGYCRKARDFMKKENISYFEYDIVKSEEGRKQYQSLRVRAVPLMLIDGELIKGYSPSKILELTNKK